MGNDVLQRLVDERAHINEMIDRVLDQANEEERALSDSERSNVQSLKEELERMEPQIAELIELEETRGKARDARSLLGRVRRETPAPPDTGDGDDDDSGDSGDGYRRYGDYAYDQLIVRFDKMGAALSRSARAQAVQRLDRAVQQVLTTDVAGMLQPQYLAQIMQVIDRSRPLVTASNQINLTAGKVQFPQITERPTVAVQATEKTEAGDGSMTVAMVETLAKTYLTAANFSWQTLQWSNPDALALWFNLAGADYAKKTDAAAAAVIAGADATPTAVATDDLEGWMAAITAAAGEVYAATGRYANTIAANPAVGYKLLGLVSIASPVFVATGGGDLSTGSFPSIAGLRFVVSSGLDASTVIVGDFNALLCAETAGAPVEMRAVEPAIGGLEVGIIGAFACAITDPGAFAEITPPVPGP